MFRAFKQKKLYKQLRDKPLTWSDTTKPIDSDRDDDLVVTMSTASGVLVPILLKVQALEKRVAELESYADVLGTGLSKVYPQGFPSTAPSPSLQPTPPSPSPPPFPGLDQEGAVGFKPDEPDLIRFDQMIEEMDAHNRRLEDFDLFIQQRTGNFLPCLAGDETSYRSTSQSTLDVATKKFLYCACTLDY